MTMALMAIFYVLFPVLVLYLCERFTVLEKIGSAMLCFIFGLIMANSGLMPGGLEGMQKTLMSITIPLAIPLIIFPTDIKRWFGLAGKALLAFGLLTVALLIVTVVGYVMFKGSVFEAEKIAAMNVAGYTGASFNSMAVGLALKTTPQTMVLSNAAAWFLEIFWILFMMFLGQRVIGLVLPPFRPTGAASAADCDAAQEYCQQEQVAFTSYRGMFTRAKLIPMLKALLLALVIFGIGAGLYALTPAAYNMTVLMLTVTTLSVLCAFIPSVRGIEMSFPLGQYIILIFCVTIASTVKFSELMQASSDILWFTGLVLFGSTVLHILFCRIFKIDTDTEIITATAGVFSPVFVPMVASNLKNRDILVSGLATGIIGYIIGNYLGISTAYVLKAFF